MNNTRNLKQYSVTAFIVCTFVLSVLVTFAPVGGEYKFLLLGALLVPIPTIVALTICVLEGDVRSFLRCVLDWRIDRLWVLIALGIALGARLLISILALLTGVIHSIEVSAASPGIAVVVYLFAFLEEVGWRGFAVHRLVSRWSPFAALLMTGVPWSIIHIFFYLNQNAGPGTLAQVFLLNFALSTMITWVYLRSKHNVWIGVILHGSQSLLSILNTNIPPDVSLPYSVIAYSIIALILMAVEWRMWFTRPAEPEVRRALPTPG